MASTASPASPTASSCSSPRRNSFDFVVDTVRTLEAEAAAAEPATTKAATQEELVAAESRLSLAGSVRPFEQEQSARFGGYQDIELVELSPGSRAGIPGHAPRPLPTAHLFRYSTMSGRSTDPSLSCQVVARTAAQVVPSRSNSDAPPSLLDDLMTVISYFRKH